MSDGIHQVAAGAAPRDAITHHMLEARAVLRGMGLRSEILADPEHIHPGLAGEVRPATRWDEVAQPGDAAILHYSIASAPMFRIAERCRRTALHYHNITPADLLWRWAPRIALECAIGRRRLLDLLPHIRLVGACSEYNARELEELGFARPHVLGVMRQELPPAPRAPGGAGGPARLLFVGRGVPNKAQHHLVMASAALADAGRDHEMWLVGAWSAAPAYEEHCRALAEALGVGDRVRFLGSVDDDELGRRYADADAFVCLSDHEGFCVPLIEAMASGLPIVAYASSAIPETLGGAGLLLPEKPPSLVAEAVMEALDNPALSSGVAAARRERLAHFSQPALVERLERFVALL
ncbi:MAG: glycosyltransferase family 4 protein [Thermoleophilia bacterium]